MHPIPQIALGKNGDGFHIRPLLPSWREQNSRGTFFVPTTTPCNRPRGHIHHATVRTPHLPRSPHVGGREIRRVGTFSVPTELRCLSRAGTNTAPTLRVSVGCKIGCNLFRRFLVFPCTRLSLLENIQVCRRAQDVRGDVQVNPRTLRWRQPSMPRFALRPAALRAAYHTGSTPRCSLLTHSVRPSLTRLPGASRPRFALHGSSREIVRISNLSQDPYGDGFARARRTSRQAGSTRRPPIPAA
jgi:hypothetical protein